MGEEGNKTTTVRIGNQTYQVRSGGDPQYVKQLAQYVDDRMTEVIERTPTVDSLKVAVLAALNIADEYFSTRDRLEVLEVSILEKTDEMNRLLEPFSGTRST